MVSTFKLGISDASHRKFVSQPYSLFFQPVECTSRENANNTCVVILGQLTLYSDVGNGASSQQQTIQDSLETDMNAGTFNDVQKDIVRVTYVDLLPRTDQGSSGASNGATTSRMYGSSEIVSRHFHKKIDHPSILSVSASSCCQIASQKLLVCRKRQPSDLPVVACRKTHSSRVDDSLDSRQF